MYEVSGFKIMEPFLRHKANDIEKWLPSHLYGLHIYSAKNCGLALPYFFKVTTKCFRAGHQGAVVFKLIDLRIPLHF